MPWLALCPPPRFGTLSPSTVIGWHAKVLPPSFSPPLLQFGNVEMTFFYSNSRSSQTKVKIYVTELLSASLSCRDKSFSGRLLQEFCHFLPILPYSKFWLLGAQLLSFSFSFLHSGLLGFPVLGLLCHLFLSSFLTQFAI